MIYSLSVGERENWTNHEPKWYLVLDEGNRGISCVKIFNRKILVTKKPLFINVTSNHSLRLVLF